jgi:hypothetical protein
MPPVATPGPMTLETVHKMTMFELRQELTKRGAWDFKEDEITYRAVLAKMVKLLLEEKEEREQAQIKEAEEKRLGGTVDDLKERWVTMMSMLPRE